MDIDAVSLDKNIERSPYGIWRSLLIIDLIVKAQFSQRNLLLNR